MEKRTWTPAELLELSGSYWSTCTLHAGVKLGVFTMLDGQAMTAGELAKELGCDARGTEMLLNALAALGLLEKQEGDYIDNGFSSQFLSKDSHDYLGHIIMHHHHLVEGWSRLDEAVRNGKPVRERVSHEDVEASRESFLMGMFNLANMLAPRIVSQIDLRGHRRLLDVGGGPGTYAIHFVKKNPELEAVICDLPTTRSFAEKTVAHYELSDRIGFIAVDFEKDELPRGFDVAWLSHVLHGVGPDTCAAVLRNTVTALEPGGKIFIQEFILDETRDSPVFPALFSLNMLLGTPEGQSYSQDEIVEMLKTAGATDMHRLPIDLPNGAGIIAATVPEK